jgi:vancomycin resistance protein VanJ
MAYQTMDPNDRSSMRETALPRSSSSRWKSWARVTLLGSSALLCLTLSVCYTARFDAVTALTVFPVWVWLVPGTFLTLMGWHRKTRRHVCLIATAWLVFLLGFAEEPWSLWRSLARTVGTEPDRINGRERVRVVSLNCAIGNPNAANEVRSYRPNVVLLQESPGRSEVEALAELLFGEEAAFIHAVDASMIVHGKVTPAPLPLEMRSYFVQARVRLPSGEDIEVVCTRLVPAVFRLDLWSGDCWREQAENRRKRRAQLRAISDRIARIPANIPVILGGDFNAPQGDAVFRLLRPTLHDAFGEAGRGWGNTIVNDYPFLRIDQIWVSHHLRAIDVAARKTVHSDHRMVVCDLTVLKATSQSDAP